MLEEFFARFRENIVGVNHRLQGPYGSQPLVLRGLDGQRPPLRSD